MDGSILGLDGPGAPEGVRPQASVTGETTAQPVIPAEAIGTERGAFKVTEAGVVWACTRCGTENSMDEQFCEVCGSTFGDTLLPPPPEGPKRDPGMTAIWSLIFPGAGHAYLGMWGQAVSRGMISVWVTMTALLTAIQAENGLPLVAIIFGLAATALWIVHAHDAYREALGDGRAVLMKGRVFLYVVLGLLGLLIVLLVGAAVRGGSSGDAEENFEVGSTHLRQTSLTG
ncbi:MAG: zinc ribbon domain-containing protein [Actinomycetota bacterium]